MVPTSLIAGSRSSQLALTQTRWVMAQLTQQYPELAVELKQYTTQGDLNLEQALSKLNDKGLFVKELELALSAGEIDFAVHSMKDMPSEQPDGLTLLPFGVRENPQDAWVSRSGASLTELPEGACVGTSSLRRQAQLGRQRPDLRVEVIRGNVDTRLRKLDEGQYDAIILAAAGLNRLGLARRITQLLPVESFIPACCQGILGIELRADASAEALWAPFIDTDTWVAMQAERSFLATLQGGCQVPMAAHACAIGEGRYRLLGMVSDVTGQQSLTTFEAFNAEDATAVGQRVAQALLLQGADALIAHYHA